MNLLKNIFGKYRGQDVFEYTLDNGCGFNVKIINYGGIIREINFKGKNRVLGFDNLEAYVNNTAYLGTLLGRVAGRISNGKIEIDNETYILNQNEGTTCIHGGKDGLSFQLWELVEEISNEDLVSITLKYKSSNMESGFPGNLTVFAKYTINKDDCLTIEYSATTDKSTPITLTNHSYFNLNDNLNEDILDHSLRIDADTFIKLDEKNIPKNIANVEGTDFDFRNSKTIKQDMNLLNEDLIITEGYDHPFILNNGGVENIELHSEKSGVSLRIATTEPVVILYCSNKLSDGLLLTGGEKTFKYQGVCLETQWFPDALNQEFLPDNILSPNERYYSKTSYSFTII